MMFCNNNVENNMVLMTWEIEVSARSLFDTFIGQGISGLHVYCMDKNLTEEVHIAWMNSCLIPLLIFHQQALPQGSNHIRLYFKCSWSIENCAHFYQATRAYIFLLLVIQHMFCIYLQSGALFLVLTFSLLLPSSTSHWILLNIEVAELNFSKKQVKDVSFWPEAKPESFWSLNCWIFLGEFKYII